MTALGQGKAINTVLQTIGEALDIDCIVVIKNFDVPSEQLPRWQVLYQWNALCTPSQNLHTKAAQGRWDDIQEWYEPLSQGQALAVC